MIKKIDWDEVSSTNSAKTIFSVCGLWVCVCMLVGLLSNSFVRFSMTMEGIRAFIAISMLGLICYYFVPKEK